MTVKRLIPGLAIAGAVMVIVAGCGTSRRVAKLRKEEMKASLMLPQDRDYVPEDIDDFIAPKSDTIRIVDFEGKEVMLMNAIKDDNGEMVAHQVLASAVITARFRNVAERHGEVDLVFDIAVPKAMLDGTWQTRFQPELYIMQDSTLLEKVILTGVDYRKSQLKGYQQYNRFVSRIISDTTKFIDLRTLENFLQRNLPHLYAFKTDSAYVSDEVFNAAFGVTEEEAIEHYTNKVARYFNKSRIARKGAAYRRYIKAPIDTTNVRLDSVFTHVDSDFVYTYVQTIKTRPKLRKAEIVLGGAIYEQDVLLYNIPKSEPLTFYISSLSSFTDHTERYLTKVIERKAEANTACYIAFEVGKADIDLGLGNNREEISRIKGNIRDLLLNEKFDLDSLTISASASPEGSFASNGALSLRRAESTSKYFEHYISHVQDSLARESGFTAELDEHGHQTGKMVASYKRQDIRILSRSGGENWEYLDHLIQNDTVIDDARKARYLADIRSISNPDEREAQLMKEPYYRHLREEVYPRLRMVKFDFFLHRKGMIKDTVHTTELDTLYMRGVQALDDRDYKTACEILGRYKDYNAAVAYMANDMNLTALSILEPMEKTARINYLLAIIYSRQGKEQQAVQCYVRSCQQDRSYVNRGNLDPEITVLIKRYKLNELEKDPYDDFSF